MRVSSADTCTINLELSYHGHAIAIYRYLHANALPPPQADAATSGTWGAARNVRLEHTSLRVASCALPWDASVSAVQIRLGMALLRGSTELELVHGGSTCLVARLRCKSHRYASSRLSESTLPGVRHCRKCARMPL